MHIEVLIDSLYTFGSSSSFHFSWILFVPLSLLKFVLVKCYGALCIFLYFCATLQSSENIHPRYQLQITAFAACCDDLNGQKTLSHFDFGLCFSLSKRSRTVSRHRQQNMWNNSSTPGCDCDLLHKHSLSLRGHIKVWSSNYLPAMILLSAGAFSFLPSCKRESDLIDFTSFRAIKGDICSERFIQTF